MSDKAKLDPTKKEWIINSFGEEEEVTEITKARKKAENFFTNKGIILD